MPSSNSFLFATCLYSAIGTTPSAWAMLRMLSASTPPSSASTTAALSTRPLLSGGRDCAATTAFVVISTISSAVRRRRQGAGRDNSVCVKGVTGRSRRSPSTVMSTASL